MGIEDIIRPYQIHVNDRLSQYLPEITTDPLRCAMRYSTLDAGKRIRPLLVYLTAEMYELSPPDVDPIALAIECIHCYSLIHDDLPAMDNDDLRRGKPTCHKMFGDATAILAGDALLTLAFEILTQDNIVSPEIIHFIAKAAGTRGMVGGQALDLAGENQPLTLSQLITIHNAKTGALITASVVSSALATSRANAKERSALHTFGQSIGLAFQIHDDILDTTGHSDMMGKHPHQDHKKQKSTFVTQLGLDEASTQAHYYYANAIRALDVFGQKADRLRELSAFIIQRAM